MRQSIAIVSLLSSAVMAADTISFYFPGGSEGVDPVATIKKVEPSTTEFNIACPTNVDASDCGWGPGLDYTVISKTHYEAQMSAESVSMSFACDHNTQASEMTCTVAMTGGNMEDASPQTAVLKGTEISFNQATIVAGANLLSGNAAQATPAASASGSAAAQTTAASAASGLKTAASSPVATGSAIRSGAGNLTSATGSAAPAQATGAASKLGFQVSAMLVMVGAVAAAL